ncbi:pyridoxamine 5'-phosphate oxidase [Oxalicibacterium flavum]|uniref:Pyridoxamine 5'-phosphate oxidase n=1 Tax=Oxalicibacterium flavum TaxID=179467 RepID=A0A8J2XY64_9BURK|nr:pyridoxamine 5'-phosphate oxidase family protein [Oxalicibacterium flavum]GGC09490.1 pyridoxamine 5'-phosphate oxidase [Oxalicibacterium flavum]
MIIPIRDAPFHAGELRAQRLAGGGPPGFAIRAAMPEQHRSFFAMLRYLLVATIDGDGWPVASIVTGRPGFIASDAANSLHIDRNAVWLDSFKSLLHAGQPIGMLGIDLNTRRRNRVNGVIRQSDGGSMRLDVTQSFGNCPKYIQVRELEDTGTPDMPAGAAQSFLELDNRARAMIAHADTFFVATGSGAHAMENGGIDISHKGGRPGFIRIDGNTLTIPDFVGNRYFNTLGNMLLDPRTALLIVDFTNGDVLHLQGRSEVLWDADETAQLAGAQRLWRFHVERGWHARHAVPLRWRLTEFAPTTEATGIWPVNMA